MSQTSVTQSARKAFGNVSNVKGSFKNISGVSGKLAFNSGVSVPSPTKEGPKKAKDLKSGGLSASCKKVTLEKSVKSLKGVKPQQLQQQQPPASCIKEKEKCTKSNIFNESILEDHYPMLEEDLDDLSFSPISMFGPTDAIKFDEEEDLPQFMAKPLKFELDLDLL
uniref:Securin n=1 Tax=Tetranychus urticae TaxID=32264 RepID=T1K8K4_TETUR